MSKQLIEKLAELNAQKTTLKRTLDINYYDKQLRNTIFEQLENIDSEINKIKFKLKIEKEIKK